MKNDNLVKRLAGDAVAQSKGYKLRKGESTDLNIGAMHQIIAEALLNWQMIEGVELKLAPLVVEPVEVKRESYKWFDKMLAFNSTVSEDETLIFNNAIILN
jgi:hypothetical protein